MRVPVGDAVVGDVSGLAVGQTVAERVGVLGFDGSVGRETEMQEERACGEFVPVGENHG